MDVGIAAGGFPDPDAIAEAVADRFRTPQSAAADELVSAELDLVLARGWSDVRTFVAAEPQTPILVVEEPAGLGPIPGDAIPAALETVEAGAHAHEEHVTLTVTVGEATHTSVTTAMVMTTDPATISEYAIRYDGTTQCEYRADGIVIATPPMSGAYPRAAGGPVLDRTLPAAVVVPVAPYRTNPDEWVLRDTVRIDVVRDEGTVGLFLEGEQADELACGDGIAVRPEGTYRTVRVPASCTALVGDED